MPVVQKEVFFYEDVKTAVHANDGQIYVPIRPICDLLGVYAAAQKMYDLAGIQSLIVCRKNLVRSSYIKQCVAVTATHS